MKKKFYEQTWAIVVGIPAAVIAGLIVNSFTKWWSALASITNTAWVATSEGVTEALTYRTPIWALLIIVALLALSWYGVRASRRTTNIPTPNTTSNFLNYREDVFDGVLCRWDYLQTSTGYKIEKILCYCHRCDFCIGSPNRHEQNALHVERGLLGPKTTPTICTTSLWPKSRGIRDGKTQCRSRDSYTWK